MISCIPPISSTLDLLTLFAVALVAPQYNASTHPSNILEKAVAEKSASDASLDRHHHHHQQQEHQHQQINDSKYHHDKENAAAAARELADQKARHARSRATELHQLEHLLGATVASSGLKHLDLRQLNVSRRKSAANCLFVLYLLFAVVCHHFLSSDVFSQLSRIPHSLCRRCTPPAGCAGIFTQLEICPETFVYSGAHHLVSIDISHNPLHQVYSVHVIT